MRCLVTGGAGFIGSHIVDLLARKGFPVAALDNFSSGAYLRPGVKMIKKDIRSEILADVRGFDAIFHFAADPDSRASLLAANSFSNNVIGTFNLLEAARKADASRFVFASSSAVYGNAPIPTKEACPVSPISNYGASKAACEAFVSSYSNCYGIKATILRIANAYGPRSRRGVMHDFYRSLRRNPNRLTVLGTGLQRKSYLHVSDCSRAIFLAFRKQKCQLETYNIGGNDSMTVIEIARALCKEMSLSPSIRTTGGDAWAGDTNLMQLDISKIRALGFSPKIVFSQGLSSYIRWLSKN